MLCCRLQILKCKLFVLVALFVFSCSKRADAEIVLNEGFSVTYHGNGHTSGSVPTDTIKYRNYENAVVMTRGALTKDGFVFSGWNTKADGFGSTYEESSILKILDSDVVLYAQWKSEVVRNEFISSNVSIIDILNPVPLPENSWYRASVDIVSGSLTLNDGSSDSKFQFEYNSIDTGNGENGFLRIAYNPEFHTVSNGGRALALDKGTIISSSTFANVGIAEISGLNHNWSNVARKYIPVHITIKNKTHYGYICVSFEDVFGQLTIHSTAYNRIPEKEILAE